MRYFQDEPRFKGVYSRNNLPKRDEGAYVINLEDDTKAGSHWVALIVKKNKCIYFDSFGVEHIAEEIERFVKGLETDSNIYRVQSYDSIMCGYYCIKFIEYMFSGKKLTDFTNLFSPNDFDLKTLKTFQQYIDLASQVFSWIHVSMFLNFIILYLHLEQFEMLCLIKFYRHLFL